VVSRAVVCVQHERGSEAQFEQIRREEESQPAVEAADISVSDHTQKQAFILQNLTLPLGKAAAWQFEIFPTLRRRDNDQKAGL
jgi:hypothetical protein